MLEADQFVRSVSLAGVTPLQLPSPAERDLIIGVARMATRGRVIIAGNTQTDSGKEELTNKGSAGKLNWLIFLSVLLVVGSACFFIRMPKTPLEHAIELIKS